jgi:hypothetical protein
MGLCVQEDLKYSSTDSKISLVTPLGPFVFKFLGEYAVVGEHEIKFTFRKSVIELLGKVIKDSDMSGKEKSYKFIVSKDGVIVSRSSAGGLTLCVQKSAIKPATWKPDFLAMKL